MPTEHCNRVRVERYFLGDSGAEEKGAVRAHLDGCADCRGILAGFETQKRDYLMEHPFREFAAKRLPADAPARKASTLPRWLPAFAGLAACLALVPVLMIYGTKPAGVAVVSDDGIRTKGGTVLEYYVKRGEAVTPGSVAEPYRSGDELQFVYAASEHAFVSLASVDSRGHVSLYKADAAGPLSQKVLEGGKQSLPFAVTLDDSPGAELFVMIYGVGPLADAAVESWLMEAFTRASGNLEGLTSLLSPPPVPTSEAAGADAKAAKAAKTEIKTLLLRKTQA